MLETSHGTMPTIALIQQEFSLSGKLVVLNSDNVPVDSGGEPEIATQKGMSYLLGVGTVQDVLENLKQQIASPTPSQKLEALRYYLENDAFIAFKG